MVELDTLKFTVDTGPLQDAITQVKALQTAVTNLNKPLAETAKVSAKVAQETAKVVVADEKVAQAKARTAEAENKAEAAKNRAERAAGRVIKSTEAEASAVEKLRIQLDYMAKGYTTGQSSRLAAMQSSGAAIEELTEAMDIFTRMTKLKGGDPFDKSLSGVTALKNGLRELRVEQLLSDKGIELSSKQYKEFARDKLRIVEAAKIEGLSFADLKKKLREHSNEFIKLATDYNTFSAAEKSRERSARDVANAQRAVSAEDEKMISIMSTLNKSQEDHTNLTDKSARAIANYERNLRIAGVTGEEFDRKTKANRKNWEEINKLQNQQRVDNLSRALAPQISDVVVSLGSGMNPFTVMLQQGLQVRDLIGLSKVGAEDLKVAFKTAGTEMVSSLKNTAVALSSLLGGAIMDAGKAVLTFGGNVTLVKPFADALAASLTRMGVSANFLTKSFDVLGRFFVGFTGVLVAAAAILGGIYLFALKDVIKEENALNKALTATGNIAGVSYQNFSIFTAQLEQQGVTTRKSAKMLVEMAEAGNFAAKDILLVQTTADKLHKTLDIDTNETIKKFSQIIKEPTKELLEWATKTGKVDVATLKLVQSLEQSGKKTEAATLAMKAYADASVDSADRVKNQYGYLTRLGITLKEIWDVTWDSIMGWGRTKTNPERIEELKANLAKVENGKRNADGTLFNKSDENARKLWLKELNDLIYKGVMEEIRLEEEAAKKAQASAFANLKAAGVIKVDKAEEQRQMIKNIEAWGKAAKYSEVEIAKMVQTYKEGNKLSKSDAQKEAESMEKWKTDAIERFNDIIEKADGKVKELTASELALEDLKSSDKWKKATEDVRRQLTTTALLNAEREKSIKIANVQREQQEKEREQQEKDLDFLINEVIPAREKARQDSIDNNQKMNLDLQEQTTLLLYQVDLVGLLSEEQSKRVKLKKIELQYDKEIAKAKEDWLVHKKDNVYQQAKNDAAARRLQAEQNVNTEIAMDLNKKLVDGVSDAIVTGLFEGGKSGSAKLRSILEAELRKPITVFVTAFIKDVLGGEGNLLGAIFGGVTTGGNNASAATTVSLGDRIGTSIGSSISKLGDWLSKSNSSVLQKIGGWVKDSTGVLSKIGGYLSNAVMGNALYSGISNGYSINKGLDTVGKIASLFGPIYGVIGGLINRAFGRKLADQGIEGNFGAEGFTGQNFQFYKGGWFRSDKTKYSDMESETLNAFNSEFALSRIVVTKLGETLGMSTDFLDSFSKEIKISFMGLTEEQISQKLAELFGDIKNEMSDMVTGLDNFKRAGEQSLTTLQRLSESLVTVNDMFRLLGNAEYTKNIFGADQASRLADMFGGISGFSSAAGSYFQNFYTKEEQVASQTKELTRAFGLLNLEVPASITAYRKMIEAQDLNTESGMQTWSALVQLSSAFYELKNAAAEAVSAIVEEVNRLRGLVGTESTNGFESTRQLFMSNIALAAAGDSNAQAALPGLSQSLEGMFKERATSSQDVNRFRSWLANSLSQIAPAFASGGVHSGGMRIVGENGPELEVTGPSRIFDNASTMELLSGNNVVSAINVLNNNMELLRAEVRAGVTHNATTAKILTRVSPDGESLSMTGTFDDGTI